ncbi:MAG: DUF1573 domain-containing protein [Pirellulales bacterium]
MKAFASRGLLLILGIGSGGLSLWSTRLAFQPPSVPGLHAVNAVYAAGPVMQGQARAQFELINSSNAPIRIVHVVKSCQCADVRFSRKELAAGEGVAVECDWNTSGLRGQSNSEFVVFYTLGPDSALKQLRLRMEADVIPFFNYEPRRLEFAETTAEFEGVRLKSSTPDSPVKIVGANCSHPAFRVLTCASHTVEVAFLPEHWTDDVRLTPELTILTDCPTERTVRIPLTVVSQ